MNKNKTFTTIMRGVLSLMLVAQFAVAKSEIDTTLQEKAKSLSPKLSREIALQKEELRSESEELTIKGIQFIDEGKYKEAYVALTEALRKNKGNVTAISKLSRVNKVLYDAYTENAKARLDLKDYETAINWYRTALEHKPKGPGALKGIRLARKRLAETVSKNLNKIISENMTEDEQVALLIRQARDLEVQTRYEEAKALYKQAIKIESENPRPRRLLKELMEKQGRIIADDRRIERRQIMEDLIKAFFRYPEGEVDATKTGGPEEITPAERRRAEIIKKASQRVENVSFDNERIQDAVTYLAELGGLSIVLNLGSEKIEPVNITLSNPTILKALEYICEQSGLVLTIDQYAIVISRGEGEMETRFWSVSQQAVSSAEAAAEDEEDLDEFDLFADDSEDEESFEEVSAEPEIVKNIKDVVPQPQGSSVFLEPTTGTLVARNTPSNLDKIDSIIEDLGKGAEQLQVEIQARFVEVSDEDLKELSIGMKLKSPFNLAHHRKSNGEVIRGLEMMPTDLTGAMRRYSKGERNSRYADRLLDIFSMVGMKRGQNQVSDQILGFFTSAFTEPEIGLVFYAIDNKTDADVLSAPSVTTVSGQSRVSIRQIVEVLYPDEYAVYKPAIVTRGDSGFVGQFGGGNVAFVQDGYATVESTLKEEVGIELIVSPTIGEDKKTVSMEIQTQVSSEISPHVVRVYSGNTSLGAPPIDIDVPRFKYAEVKTQVVVNDGETIVLGGMIKEELREYHDKVPFFGDLPLVGRLFRAEGSYKQKKNMLIFVTTKIITPTGEHFKDVRERQAKREAEQFDEEQETLPEPVESAEPADTQS